VVLGRGMSENGRKIVSKRVSVDLLQEEEEQKKGEKNGRGDRGGNIKG